MLVAAAADGCSYEGAATIFVAEDSVAEPVVVEVDVAEEDEEEEEEEEDEEEEEGVSSGFFVSIFCAAAASVEIEWFPTPGLGLRLDDPGRGVREAAMVGSEVLGGRRLVKAAATAPCGSCRPPSAAAGAAVAATPPTGGTRGAGVGTESVTTAGDGMVESSEATGICPVVFMPDGIWACSGVTSIEIG